MVGWVQHVFHLSGIAGAYQAVGLNVQTDAEAKKLCPTEREMTTPLFLLRCVQLGLSMADTELLSIGLVNDMYTEQMNDEYQYCELGTQVDMDRF